MKLAHRLLAGAVLVVTVLIVLLVVLSGVRLRRQLEELEIAHLTREARLISREWTPTVDPDALAASAGAAIGHRVTLIDHDGRVIGDSEFRGESRTRLENHSTRPEVITALRDSVGTADRTSPSAGDNELYVAIKSQYGVTRVSVSTASLDAIVARGQRDVLLSGFVALVAALILAAAFSRAVSNPVVELRDVAQALAAGDLSRRPALSAPGEVGDLASAVHRMAEQLTSRLKALEDDDMHMIAVIESLQEGVIAVDARRQIVRVNESGRRMLRLPDEVPFSADRLPRDRTLREALSAALAGEATEPTEITVDGQSMMLTARALGDGGVVLAVFDLTASRRVEAVRRDFVANVSHELKTPLTVILGFAETLAAGDVPPEQGIRFIEAIQSTAQRWRRACGAASRSERAPSVRTPTPPRFGRCTPTSPRMPFATRTPAAPSSSSASARIAARRSACAIPAWASRPSISRASSSASIARTLAARATPAAQGSASRSCAISWRHIGAASA